MKGLLVVLIFLSSIAIAQGVLGHLFARREDLENQMAGEIPSDVLRTDKQRCVILCSRDEACAAVTHHVGQCFLYNSSLATSGLPAPGASRLISDVAAPGAETFFKRGLCPVTQGYISVPSADLCFKYYDVRMNWTDSQYQCESDGGRLIILNTVVKLDYIVAILDKRRTHPYIGLQKLGGALSWTDGSTHFPGNQAFAVGDCGHLFRGLISSYYCSWKRPSFCEIPV